MKVFVSGSIAYDIILDYPGRFVDDIDLKKIHALSVSFVLERAERTFGGTAGNIAYNLAMLKVPSALVGTVGVDGRDLLKRYKNMTIDIKLSRVSAKLGTSTAYIMTDRDDNQIAGFYPGAAQEKPSMPRAVGKDDLAIIAAENAKNMLALARHYQKIGHSYIFDPGQQVIAFSKSDLAACIRGANILIGNDYEMGVLERNSAFPLFGKERVRSSSFAKRRRGGVLIRTLGPKGSEIIYPNGRKEKIGIAKPKRVVDPTGAGDAYRAGFIKGIMSGFDLKKSAQLGATAASFAIERYGTQNHKFSYNILVKRHNKNFSSKL